jgi:hypothetical protein
MAGGEVGALRGSLNALTLNLFAPCLLFSIALKTPLSATLLTAPLLIALAVTATGLVLYFLLYVLPVFQHLSRRTRAALMLSGMFGNVFYLGYPVLTAVYGEHAGIHAALADMMASSPLLWTIGVWVALHLGKDKPESGFAFWPTFLKLPPVWAFFIGMVFNVWQVTPDLLLRTTGFVGQATIPLAMFALGLSIPWKQLKPNAAILTVSAVKLVLTPLIIFTAARAVANLDRVAANAAVIEAAMPTMLFAVLMAERFKLDLEAASLMIGVSTVLFWFTLPAWLWVVA